MPEHSASSESFFEPEFFIPASEEHIKREKAKAKLLRDSQWWKNLRGTGLCHYCKKRFPPRELTMDHIVPVIRSGMSSKSNIVACCKTCNTQKKYLLPIEWQEYLALLQAPEKRN
ncbi:MAG: HNH endonuclease [Lentisphaeria bacterium]